MSPSDGALSPRGQLDSRDGVWHQGKTRYIAELSLQSLIGPDFSPRRPEVKPHFSALRAPGNHPRDGFLIGMAEDDPVGADQDVLCPHRLQQLRRGVSAAAMVAEFDQVELPWKLLSSADGKCREGTLKD